MRRVWWLVAGLVLAACGRGAGAGDGRLTVVAGFYPPAEAAQRVGGDLIDVVNLTPAGSEPHDLELSADQFDRIEDADLVVYLGGGFQPAVEAAVDGADPTRLDLAEAVRLDESGGETDPHFWLDPTRQSDAVTAIEEALADLAPEHADAFADNAEDYRAELAALDVRFEVGLASCERGQLVTSHAAFHYLADRYGLEQVAISGVTPESEPDPARLADLADLVDRHGVTTVFHEPLAPADLAETLAREAGVRTDLLDPIEGLSDEAIDDRDTYVSVMDENLAALREALGCR
jgi:zinc transport system substrate-binding protein